MMTCWYTKYIEWTLFWSSDLYSKTHHLSPRKRNPVRYKYNFEFHDDGEVGCFKFVMAINFCIRSDFMFDN